MLQDTRLQVPRQKRISSLRNLVANLHLVTLCLGLTLVTAGAYLFTSEISRTVCYSLLVLGCLVALVGFVACFGSHMELTGFIRFFITYGALVLLAQLVLCCYMYWQSSALNRHASDLWSFFFEHDPAFLWEVESVWSCCGYASSEDRPVPSSCHLSENACRATWLDFIGKWQFFLILGVCVLLSFQICVLVMNCVLMVLVERENRDFEMHEALFEQAHYSSAPYHAHPVLGRFPSHPSSSGNNGALPPWPRPSSSSMGGDLPHYGSVSK
ncbi:hypothetical protein BC940DRAFT_305505 [Gongronella butleri]|nr:hypothetical protein BC940DRAFT_305505 [Gongronella butleri]